MLVRRAFTLIELLVVIAIIAILAAILFPVFSQAKNAAKGVACISQMKQLGVAASLYRSDNEDTWFPIARYEPLAGFADIQMWVGYDNQNGNPDNEMPGAVNQPATHPIRPGMVDPYLKSEEIKRCPNKPSRSQTAWALNGWSPNDYALFYNSHPERKNLEYGPGSKTITTVNGYRVYTAATESEIERPADLIAVWEHDAIAPMCNFLMQYDWVEGPPNDKPLIDHFNFLHTSGTNSLFADSHVKRHPYGSLKRSMFTVRQFD